MYEVVGSAESPANTSKNEKKSDDNKRGHMSESVESGESDSTTSFRDYPARPISSVDTKFVKSGVMMPDTGDQVTVTDKGAEKRQRPQLQWETSASESFGQVIVFTILHSCLNLTSELNAFHPLHEQNEERRQKFLRLMGGKKGTTSTGRPQTRCLRTHGNETRRMYHIISGYEKRTGQRPGHMLTKARES